MSILAGAADLNGMVNDDGQPNPPGVTTSLWTVDSQPAGSTINFADDTQPVTSVTFDTPGEYVLRLSACDDGTPGTCSGLENSDTMTLTVEADYIWDGGDPASDNWSLATNWVGDVVPAFTGGGSILTFTGSTRLTPNNDVSGADVASIIFDAAAGGFVIRGNALTVRSDISNDSAILQTLNPSEVALGAGAAEAVSFAAAADLSVPAVVSGEGGLAKSGAGVLTLSNANTYGGLTTVNDGTLDISTATALGGVPADFAGMKSPPKLFVP